MRHKKTQDLGDPVSMVIDAYDRVAEAYCRARRKDFRERRFWDLLIRHVPTGARVLDVGCGAGVPIARYLIDRGFRVTGVDASARMLALARLEVPEAVLLESDMRRLNPAGPFDALVSWDSVFHLPRAEHAALFSRFVTWLRPRGLLLISLGGSEGELTSEMFGARFFYDALAPGDSVRHLEAAGFEILSAEVDDPTSRGHVVFLCRVEPGGAA